MKVVMGALNGVRLFDIMNGATGRCSRVTAAVAYATGNSPFFEHCLSEKIFLDFYGLLDEDGAVAVAVLQKLLDAGPVRANCRLIKGHFHSKIIWWHGYGAYIGSANLTSSAWFSNVECGIFYEELEIIGSAIQLEFEHQFDYLRMNSSPLTTELVVALKKMRPFDEAVNREKSKLQSQFDLATKGIPSHQGLASYGPSLKSTAYTRFTSEWNETLELLRGMCQEFRKLNLRPSWVPEGSNPTVHFDQFLHAFYYVRVPDERESGDETAKSVELVNKSFLKNRSDPGQALRDTLLQRVGVDRLAKISDIGSIFGFLRCGSQAKLDGTFKIFKDFLPGRVLIGAAAMTFIDHDQVKEVSFDGPEYLVFFVGACECLIQAEVDLVGGIYLSIFDLGHDRAEGLEVVDQGLIDQNVAID